MSSYLQKEDGDYLLQEIGDKIILDEISMIFSDVGEGADSLLVDKVLIIGDSGSGVEALIVDKLKEFADSGVGVDVFLKDWAPLFTDSGSGLEAYYKVFHYPRDLKKVIVLIRDNK